jgi:inner membrane protein
MACSIVPDLDVIGFSFGIEYGDLWGHRGMTHSLLFASLLSALLTRVWHRQKSKAAQVRLFFYLFFCTASHGLLDALTDGGLGVAFFSPFDTTRYFFSARPVAVSPIGISTFFSKDAFHVLASEVQWIWLPTIAVLLIVRMLQYVRSAQRMVKPAPKD